MKLDDFDISESIFVDANISIYVSQNDPTYGRACIDFLERIEYMEIKAITTPVVLN
jgi:predicted nucleic acid-binding protein